MKTLTIALLALGLSAAPVVPAQAETTGVPQKGFVLPPVKAYLSPGEVPNSQTILPAPPVAGSAAEARDIEASKQALALFQSARWQLAAADADLQFPSAVRSFECALGIAIDARKTPALYRLMQRTMLDFGLSTYPTKKQYQRSRPFMLNGQPVCTPEYEAVLRKDGSYPSGHSAVGFGWGLLLSTVAPERAAQLVRRGIDFGDSRRVCNVHWLSDVETGRLMAAAIHARLQADKAYKADIQQAGKEYRRSMTKGRMPTVPCTTDGQ